MYQMRVQSKMAETFQFQTEPFHYSEVTLKGEKKYYVEGFVSTIDPDLKNEIVDMEGQRDILTQIKGNIITMDIDHEEWFELSGGVQNPENTDSKVLNSPKGKNLPVAKIVEAELRAQGVWVKAEINKHLPDFNSVWGSIKDRFLHSFSIAFYPVKAITKSIGGIAHTFISALKLVNVTLTGCPVNPSATFIPIMKAALKSEGIKVTEETIQPEQPIQPESVVTTQEEPVSTEDVIKKIQEERDTLLAERDKLLEEKKTWEMKVQKPEPVVITQTEIDHGPLSAIKALTADKVKLQKEVASLKAELAKPIMKAYVSRSDSIATEELNKENKMNGPMDKIQ
jgi:fructose-specific phosphotransferase system component IIB